jgi:cytidylate kinase
VTASPSDRFVVTIDGPAAAGKSSTALEVARAVGFRHVDSGSLYRAATAAQLRVDPEVARWTEGAVLAAARAVAFVPRQATFVPQIDGADLEGELRGGAVTRTVSLVAQMPAIRAWVNGHVCAAARESDIVVDGRDMGTVVFPEAALKIFLVADPWERARRRLIDRIDRGPTDAEIAAETALLVQRDARDATQTVQARDAILIDTTHLTQAEQVRRIAALVHAAAARRKSSSENHLSIDP